MLLGVSAMTHLGAAAGALGIRLAPGRRPRQLSKLRCRHVRQPTDQGHDLPQLLIGVDRPECRQNRRCRKQIRDLFRRLRQGGRAQQSQTKGAAANALGSYLEYVTPNR